ncbi:dipeptidase [Georgenia alba]|uniref:Dipeptidase n=1 Tax=Georgenia alba TaxID=2233858 RepID=A0ABW2Q6T5_9MICO
MPAPADLVHAVLSATPLVDGHNDLPYALRTTAESSVEGLEGSRPELHTDLPRLRAGRVGTQFWSVFVPSPLTGPDAVLATLEQVDTAHRLIARYPDTFAFVRTAEQAREAFRGGRIASLLGAEGGHSIGESLGALRVLARLGVRYMTLTHNDNTPWADSATDNPTVGGLNEFGRSVVAEMNRIGMLVDLSHTAETTQLAALEVTTAPVIYSHSSCRAVCGHPRNASDAALEVLARNGGVLQVTFVPKFVSNAAADWVAARREVETGATAVAVAEWEAAHPRPRVRLEDVVVHVEHAREVAGIDHIGLGGDYDGTDWLPEGLEDVSGYPRLLEALAERGWSRSDLAALAGENVLRVMRDAEDAATEAL